MDYHLLRIMENAESITTLYFRPPGSFTNAVIQKPEITNVIRDADTNEQLLFRIEDRTARRVERGNNNNGGGNGGNGAVYSEEVARALDKTHRHLSDLEAGVNNDVNVDMLCAAINDISRD